MKSYYCSTILTRKTFALVLIGFLIHQCSWGQNLVFKHLTAENGLSQSAVMAITQDKRGFIWFGTRYGLDRYDGLGFKIYKNSPNDARSLSNNLVTGLFVDHEGTLWIATSNGLNKYNTETDDFEQIRFKAGDKTGLLSDSINCVYEDSKHNIWVGTKNGLNLLIDKKKNKFQSEFGSNNKVINSFVRIIQQTSDGSVWVGTSTELERINVNSKNYEYETFHHDNKISTSISANYVTSIVEDKNKNIWFGTLHNGINLYNKTTNSFTSYLQSTAPNSPIISNSIRKMTLARDGQIWIGTQDGLSIFDPVSKKGISYQHDPEVKTSLTNNSIHSIFQDIQGNMWIGTYHGGVNMTYSYTTQFSIYQNKRLPSSLSNNIVTSIIEDEKSNLWIGTEGGGLNYFNRKTGNFTIFKNNPYDSNSISSNLIKVIYKDRNNNYWIGASYNGGLNLFTPSKGTFKHISIAQRSNNPVSYDEVVAVLQDSKNNIWVGSQSGLTLLNKKNGEFENHTSITPLETQLTNKDIHVLFEDSQNNIWIGTAAGLYLLKNNSDKVIAYLKNEGIKSRLQSDFINCIYEDAKKRIWIGTYYGGLSLYDPQQNTFTTYTDKDGLPNDNILGILEDNDHNLWLSTDNGLAEFNTQNKSFKTYTTSDGLAGNKFNYNSFLKDSHGEMYFGGNNGFSSFFPKDIEINKFIAPIVFTSLELSGNTISVNQSDNLLKKDISLTEKITFNYKQDIFTINFALLNYIKPEKNKYAFQLEGFENNWNYVSKPAASFANLPSGNYTLKIKAANNDGIWTSVPISIRIEILPPFWKTWWAYSFYFIIISVLLFFFLRFFWLREMFKRENELQQFKLNFFTNISHEIRTHLTLITGPVEKLLFRYKDDDYLVKQLDRVKMNSDSLMNLVSELLDFRKAETKNLLLHATSENIVSFIEEIYSSFQEIAVSRNIQTTFTYNNKKILLFFDKRQMGKVIFNLLSNAFKFTPNGGSITIDVTEKNNEVSIQIIDDGKGIAPENLKKLFANFFQVEDAESHNTGYGIGLALAKSIVELHKGALSVESELAKDNQNGHTCFTVTLLKGIEHFTQDQLLPDGKKSATLLEHVAISNSDEAIIEESKKKPIILLVEDNDELRTFIKESLNDQYTIIESVNGSIGLEMAFEIIPELIISDIMMPEMDGLSMAKRIRKDERSSHIPIIFLTAKASPQDQEDGLEIGVDTYIVKPFSIKVLELHIRNLIASRIALRIKYSRQVMLEPTHLPINNIDEDFLTRAMGIIEEHIEDPEFGVAMLSVKVGMSQPILYKKLKALTDLSVNDFIKSIRLKKAAQLLLEKQLTVYQIAFAVGYNDRKYFSQEFKKQYGKTPSEYQLNH